MAPGSRRHPVLIMTAGLFSKIITLYYKCVEELFISCSSFVCEGVVFVWRASLDCLLWTDVSLWGCLVKMCLVEVLMNGWWIVMHGKYLIFLFWSVCKMFKFCWEPFVIQCFNKQTEILSFTLHPNQAISMCFFPWNIKLELRIYTVYIYGKHRFSDMIFY